ncbi:MAG TPA: hypothetical protein VIJ10_13925 [Vicinamibacteria bacterium]|jgi:hypothetical protein
MKPKRLLAAAVLALLGLMGATLEAALVHTDDGCAVETHCNACLLRLRTPGVVTTTFSVPGLGCLVEAFVAEAPHALRDAAPQTLASRGPPRG